MKPFQWKIDAGDLMTGKFVIPKQVRIFRKRQWAEVAMQKAHTQPTEDGLLMRVWMCPGGWLVLNHHYEALGGERGNRKQVWYALIPQA